MKTSCGCFSRWTSRSSKMSIWLWILRFAFPVRSAMVEKSTKFILYNVAENDIFDAPGQTSVKREGFERIYFQLTMKASHKEENAMASKTTWQATNSAKANKWLEEQLDARVRKLAEIVDKRLLRISAIVKNQVHFCPAKGRNHYGTLKLSNVDIDIQAEPNPDGEPLEYVCTAEVKPHAGGILRIFSKSKAPGIHTLRVADRYGVVQSVIFDIEAQRPTTPSFLRVAAKSKSVNFSDRQEVKFSERPLPSIPRLQRSLFTRSPRSRNFRELPPLPTDDDDDKQLPEKKLSPYPFRNRPLPPIPSISKTAVSSTTALSSRRSRSSNSISGRRPERQLLPTHTDDKIDEDKGLNERVLGQKRRRPTSSGGEEQEDSSGLPISKRRKWKAQPISLSSPSSSPSSQWDEEGNEKADLAPTMMMVSRV